MVGAVLTLFGTLMLSFKSLMAATVRSKVIGNKLFEVYLSSVLKQSAKRVLYFTIENLAHFYFFPNLLSLFKDLTLKTSADGERAPT